ncbi:Efg1 protein [Starmerella bacillaris]|uniref:rRNA-processing protein EFG1 n=1 Tax=Starmerella bacillaris TaxID=1247836 RepID=A0AAV5RDS2_STABA|nr:Efg1 protein [Starmerella bacillaris]
MERSLGTGRIRKKIRDLERLLKVEGLPATKKQETERAIHSYKNDLEKAKESRTISKVSQKYKMVKFFESRKALRALKKPGAGDEQLRNFYYIQTYPPHLKYRALYASESYSVETHPYLKDVEAKMASGELATGEEAIKKLIRSSKKKLDN